MNVGKKKYHWRKTSHRFVKYSTWLYWKKIYFHHLKEVEKNVLLNKNYIEKYSNYHKIVAFPSASMK
jgi:hypothetical protein